MIVAGREVSDDVFCVFVRDQEFRTWDCVAAPDAPSGVVKAVFAYQELYRGRRPIRVFRDPRKGNPSAWDCGFCGRPHWDRCMTDSQGNVVPIGKEDEYHDELTAK